MAYRRYRRSRRSRQPKSMAVTAMNPINRMLSQVGIKNRSLRWAATGIGTLFVLRVLAEDQFNNVMGWFDQGAEAIQDRIGMN